MMKIYGTAKSRTARCLWAAEELELDYEFIEVVPGLDSYQKWFLDLNPNGKVPAFEDQGLKLFESAAICNHMARMAPERNLIPQCNREYAIFEQWMYFVMSELEQPLWSISKHKFALPSEYRIESMKNTALYEWKKALEILEKGLEEGGSYLIAGTFSIADIMVVQTLQWARAFQVPIPSDQINAYRKRALARPAFQRMATKYFIP